VVFSAVRKAADMTEKIDIVTSVKTAFEYGPFYFALLLLLTVSTLAGRTYRNVCKRPESTPAERETHRKYFVASYALGLVLVGVSVVWWVAFRPKLYSYSVVIRNLHDYESVASERTVYFQPEATNLIDEEGAQTRNERVLAIQDRPFKSGQRIRLDYAKDRRPRCTY